jgi:hypothetical protein
MKLTTMTQVTVDGVMQGKRGATPTAHRREVVQGGVLAL